MIGILYTQVNLICIAIMVIIAISVFSSGESKLNKYVLGGLTFFCFLMFSSDSIWALSTDNVIPKSFALIYAANFFYYIASAFVAFCWYLLAETFYFGNQNVAKEKFKNTLLFKSGYNCQLILHQFTQSIAGFNILNIKGQAI
ncbi:MAG: hypothetical protein IKZ94_01080, partial [Lachnospiraceae bacterium]|nr:hypothetical protein [Lachnospiraceae bacterium]